MSAWDAVKLAARKVVTRTLIFWLEIQQQEAEHLLNYYRSLERSGHEVIEATALRSHCFGLSVRIAQLKASL